ncbi:MAG: ATP-binding protein [Bryobacteraceae bacterium]|nr:ATP-binding protein [Bryobacteraceae bacterium]
MDARAQTWQLASTLDSVDWAEAQVMAVAQDAGFGEDECHEIGLAVREALVNAVVHGNHYSTEKQVNFSLEPTVESLKIVIEDSGTGLDLAKLRDPLAEENLLRPSGRGLLIVGAYMDEFTVERRVEGGTRLRLVKNRPTA